MELKHGFVVLGSQWYELLIVPYGIETVSGIRKQKVHKLLIVPYGIETELCIVKMANRVLF